MPTPQARRWVFFDLGDTLIRLRCEVYRRWAAEISNRSGRTIGKTELARAIRDELQKPERAGPNLHLPEGDGETAFLESLYRDVLVRLGHEEAAAPGADERWDTVVDLMVQDTKDPDSFDWRGGMAETVDELLDQGIKVGIISNAFASVQGLLERFDLQERFKPIILSYEEGVAKPDRRIFDLALEHAEAQEAADDSEAYFVDDRRAFRQAAARAGMKALPPNTGRIRRVLAGRSS